MIVLASRNGRIGLPAAIEVMAQGGSAIDAVEAGTRVVERNPEDPTVGLGGLPNILGEVRLDASIMDGSNLKAGAVGSVQRHVHAITLARRLMERGPHVFLVADGAERLARDLGLVEEEPLTDKAASTWQHHLQKRFPDLDLSRIHERRDLLSIVDELQLSMAGWDEMKQVAGPGSTTHGTVNFLAQDRDGNVASAVSTSGWAWGYPGRLGDSPVLGSGSYADNRWGAAASTGTGEVVLRMSTSRSILLYMKIGMDLNSAVREALADLRALDDPLVEHIAVIALNREGEHVGLTYRPNERYVYLTDKMSEPAEVDMVHLDAP